MLEAVQPHTDSTSKLTRRRHDLQGVPAAAAAAGAKPFLPDTFPEPPQQQSLLLLRPGGPVVGVPALRAAAPLTAAARRPHLSVDVSTASARPGVATASTSRAGGCIPRRVSTSNWLLASCVTHCALRCPAGLASPQIRAGLLSPARASMASTPHGGCGRESLVLPSSPMAPPAATPTGGWATPGASAAGAAAGRTPLPRCASPSAPGAALALSARRQAGQLDVLPSGSPNAVANSAAAAARPLLPDEYNYIK